MKRRRDKRMVALWIISLIVVLSMLCSWLIALLPGSSEAQTVRPTPTIVWEVPTPTP